jgi:hypothetical protein
MCPKQTIFPEILDPNKVKVGFNYTKTCSEYND